MNYWWVNQKQTYRHEIPGGYMWSPKRNSNGALNRAYESMRIVCPGDFIFSFADGFIKAIGFASSHCYDFPKPDEFGSVGGNWSNIGWKVDVDYQVLDSPIRPKEHIQTLVKLLPPKYSPLQANGNGNQTFYLLDIDKQLALALGQLMGNTVLNLVRANSVREDQIVHEKLPSTYEWEDAVERSISANQKIPETTRQTLVQARRGQGQFRSQLSRIEKACRITKVTNKEHLVASHTKPWRDCSNEERLDPENGFMLTPTVDSLFDRGFISFENSGELLISEVADHDSLQKMGIPTDQRFNVGVFSEGQKGYLDWHRNSLFLTARR